MLDFGRDLCTNLQAAGEREWLITNGLGSYASGTIAGPLTRRYHGLLIAALQPPLGRTLMLTKLDETATYHGRDYPLFANRWASGQVEPAGFYHLERFHLEGTTPVWTYACADALLEKRVWMQPGANTTYVRYDLRRGSGPMTLSVKALANHRNHHGSTRAAGSPARVEPVEQGLRVTPDKDATPLYLLSARAAATPQREWYQGYFLSVENYRGLDALDNHLYAGLFQATLQPGESLTLVASTGASPNLDGTSAYAERRDYEDRLLARARAVLAPMPPAIEHLTLAADQFVVHRSLPGDPDGRSVIAGYPWFGDWGRDTMISLPGLALATGRPDVAARILRTYAHFADQGMLPNRFPDGGTAPEYNTVDATLWYFEAIRASHAATGDDALLRDLFPVLEEIIEWYQRGTRYQIHVDPSDGLLYAGEPGVQLTWMDAIVDGRPVTPRTGKPVEINALWLNALRIMADISRRLGASPTHYVEAAERADASFSQFWNEDAGYCYDVLDGPDGDDPSLRPNQLLAVSLPHSPLTVEQQRAVVDACARHLLTPHGLRSLGPGDPAYTGHYGGDVPQRDTAYHRGTAWGWLIGPFVTAHLRVYGDPALARSYLWPLIRHLAGHGVGSASEIFDGDPPFTPRGCIAQAWSVAELLRAWWETGR
jgi:predicted glycogen debranching enzyme